MRTTVIGLMRGAIALCCLVLVSCVMSPPRPAAEYRVPPQGPDERAVAHAFEDFVRAFGRQDWGDVMAAIADDAQIESTAPEAAGPAGVRSPRVLTKVEFGQALKPMMDNLRGYHVEDVALNTVSPTQVRVSGDVTVLMAGRPSLHRDRLWVFEKRGKYWLVMRAQDL